MKKQSSKRASSIISNYSLPLALIRITTLISFVDKKRSVNSCTTSFLICFVLLQSSSLYDAPTVIKKNCIFFFLQEAAAKMDAAHNRYHYRAAALEFGEIKKELHAKELLVQALQAEVDKLQ